MDLWVSPRSAWVELPSTSRFVDTAGGICGLFKGLLARLQGNGKLPFSHQKPPREDIKKCALMQRWRTCMER